ncbi:MAG TPA: VWA domain-containing protein [Vicinamibacterales bacterium]
MRAAGLILAALLAAFPSVAASGQRPAQPPAFRSGVQLLEVDARVFDRDGRFVETLTIDDFEIIEDGKPQTIQTMFLVGGSRAAAGRAATAGAAVDAAASGLPRAPQTWIFIFDRKHLRPGGYRRAKVALDAFMKERFRAGDLAGIVADEKMIDNRITSVRAEFLSTLAKVRTPGDSAARDADAAEAAAAGGDGEAGAAIREALGILNAREVERAARDTVELLDELARGLATMPGPKTVVMMSDGFALGRLEEAVRRVVGQMNRAGARVYAVDTRGIAGPPGDAVNSLAADTGGLVLFNVNNLGPVFDEIAADTNTYYVLGYQPLNTKFDGKYRRIEVRVKRPELTVRARKGYLALAPSMMLVPKQVR